MFEEGVYRSLRSLMPSGNLKWIDRYNYEAAELQDLISRNSKPLETLSFDLSVAQTTGLAIKRPGRGFGIYTYTTGDATKTVVTDTLFRVRINKDLSECEYPGKHQRGYRGDFFQLFLYWPAQTNVSCDLVIHNFDDRQWQGGQEAT